MHRRGRNGGAVEAGKRRKPTVLYRNRRAALLYNFLSTLPPLLHHSRLGVYIAESSSTDLAVELKLADVILLRGLGLWTKERYSTSVLQRTKAKGFHRATANNGEDGDSKKLRPRRRGFGVSTNVDPLSKGSKNILVHSSDLGRYLIHRRVSAAKLSEVIRND
ncbi:unnamed protein product [Calypogeia fissa]